MKIQLFWDNLIEINSTPTSFGRWYMKHKSQNLLSRSTFLYFREKTKKIDADRFLEKVIWSLLKNLKKN